MGFVAELIETNSQVGKGFDVVGLMGKKLLEVGYSLVVFALLEEEASKRSKERWVVGATGEGLVVMVESLGGVLGFDVDVAEGMVGFGKRGIEAKGLE